MVLLGGYQGGRGPPKPPTRGLEGGAGAKGRRSVLALVVIFECFPHTHPSQFSVPSCISVAIVVLFLFDWGAQSGAFGEAMAEMMAHFGLDSGPPPEHPAGPEDTVQSNSGVAMPKKKAAGVSSPLNAFFSSLQCTVSQ